MNNALDLGFKTDGSDNTTILNLVAPKVKSIYFPAGSYTFSTEPMVLNSPLKMEGEGINSTSFIRDFPGNLFHSTATFQLENASIQAVNKKNGGCAIYLRGLGASASNLKNLYITSPDGTTYQAAITLFGESQHLGIRGCYMEQVETFACTAHNIWLLNAKGFIGNGIQTYQAGGTVQQLTIQNIAEHRSQNILITSRYLPNVYAYNTDNLKILSVGNTAIGGAGSTNVKAL